MTQLEILRLAHDQLLAKREYYCQRIEALEAEGQTHSIFDYRKTECEKKLREISGMILREGIEDGLKEGDEKVKEVTTAFAETL